MSPLRTLTRRGLVAVGAITLVAAAAAAARPLAAVAGRDGAPPPADAWLARMDGEHRQFFDAPAPAGGIGLVHVLNYYDTYNKAYGVPDAAIDAVLTFYGGTTLYAVNDAAWAKYRIGEFLETVDPATKAPAVVNPWRARPTILGMSLPQASIEALQRRGATFIVCDNALTVIAGMLANARGLEPAAVYADLRASILPDVELIPGMVIAVEQAHRAGLSYQRQ